MTKLEQWAVELFRRAVEAYGGESIPGETECYAARVIQSAFEDRERKLREALDAVHYFIDASDCELIDAGMTRDEALRRARDLRDEADPEHIARQALRTGQLVPVQQPSGDVVEAVAELQLAAFLAGRGSVTGMKHGTRTAKPAPTMDQFRQMARAALGEKP